MFVNLLYLVRIQTPVNVNYGPDNVIEMFEHVNNTHHGRGSFSSTIFDALFDIVDNHPLINTSGTGNDGAITNPIAYHGKRLILKTFSFEILFRGRLWTD